ncbi:MAG: restriction endonuclease subunit S [Actinobacteria bacterium]|nr:restriction endonuclease subunit S [Actinomycetota bacterium]
MTDATTNPPTGWQTRSLGQLGRVVRGGSPRPAGDPRFFNGTFIPWLTVAALTTLEDNRMHVTETATGLTEEGSERSRTLPPNTLILANSGATLGVAKILDIKCCANDGIAALIDQHSGNKEFLCYYINTQTKYLREVVAPGNGQPNLNTRLIREIQVPFPSDPEQHAIAAVLGDVDGLTTSLDTLLAKKRLVKQGMMQELLTGRTRLPGFTEKWDTTTVGSLARVVGGGTPSTRIPAYWGGGIPWFTPAEIDAAGSGLVKRSHRTISREGLANSGACLLPAGSVLVTSRASIGNCAVTVAPASTNQGFASLVPLSPKSVWFLYYWIQHNTSELESRAAGSTFLEISARKVAAIPVSAPALDEQEAIGDVLWDADAEIAVVKTRLEKARAIKRGMMQELFNGRTRLPVEVTA